MKNIMCILVLLCSVSFAAMQQGGGPNALDWYGYNSMLSSDIYSNNSMGDQIDDDVYRKRRHRRRRKISPPKKGW